MKPKYIQVLGGAMVFAGLFVPWVIVSGTYSLIGGQILTGLPILFGGSLIALVAIVASTAPGARGSWLAALLGLLAFLYIGIYAYDVAYTAGAGVWVCLAGSLLAFAGGWMKNPGAKPQLPTPSPQARTSDAPLDQGETIKEAASMMSDKPAEQIRQAAEAGRPSEAATQAMPKALAVVLVILATLLGCFIPNIVVSIQASSYQKIFSPPEKASEILAGDTAKLYVRTEAGRAFFCDIREEPSSCQEIAPESVPKPPTSAPKESRCSYRPPPAPGMVIVSYESCEQGIDVSSFARGVILNDGSVWVWRSACDMFGCTPIPVTSMLLGTGLGFLAGVFIVEAIRLSQWARRHRRLAESKTSDAPLDQGETGKKGASTEEVTHV